MFALVCGVLFTQWLAKVMLKQFQASSQCLHLRSLVPNSCILDQSTLRIRMCMYVRTYVRSAQNRSSTYINGVG